MAYDKEHYLSVGYVDHGYFSPELSSVDPYPPYIRANADDCVNRIQAHQNRNTVSFALMADVHYSDTFNHNVRMERLVNSCKDIAGQTGFSKVFLDGDHVNDGTTEYKVHQYRRMRSYMSDLDYYPVNGNHDSNIIYERVVESRVPTHWISDEDQYKLLYNHLPAKGARFNEKAPGLYYYVDDSVSKLRYVCVDTADMPVVFREEEQKLFHEFAISQNQLDWLIEEALAVPDESWSLIFLTHMTCPPTKSEPGVHRDTYRLEVLNWLTDAYATGSVFKGEFYDGRFRLTADVDFSGRTRGKIVGFFSGHEHRDFIEYSNAGIPHIYTGCSIMYDSDSPRVLRRYDGDISELLYDIVTVDLKEHKIYLTRVGAGEDRTANYR